MLHVTESKITKHKTRWMSVRARSRQDRTSVTASPPRTSSFKMRRRSSSMLFASLGCRGGVLCSSPRVFAGGEKAEENGEWEEA